VEWLYRKKKEENVIVFDIADPETGRTYHFQVPEDRLVPLIGKRIGEEIAGDLIGFPGYRFRITGGTDKDGFPMHPGMQGPGKRRALLSGPPGFHPTHEGERRAKTMRGNVISEVRKQVNMKVVQKGETQLEEFLPKEEAAAG